MWCDEITENEQLNSAKKLSGITDRLHELVLRSDRRLDDLPHPYYKEPEMTKLLKMVLAAGLLGITVTEQAQSEDLTVETLPPVVVKTVPMSGDKTVSSDTQEIRVTFSKDMMDKSWSWSQMSKESFPEVNGDISYMADQRTCVLPVKLKPDTTYVIWLNSQKFHNFRDGDGTPAVPYLLVFKTK